MWEGRGRVAVIGWGLSEISRDGERALGALTLDACRAALDDCGLSSDEVDGLATYPDQPFRGAARTDGIDLVSVDFVLDHLRLADPVTWYAQVSQGMVASAVGEAINALLAGACRYALVWRAMRKPPGEYGGWRSERASGEDQFAAPYGLTSVIQTHALAYRRYLHRYGADPDAMAELTTNSRRNAGMNPHAIFRDRPLSRQEYLDAPMIADPLRMFDCDVPVQGCAALVLTTAERAMDLRHGPAYVLAHAQQTLHRRPVPHPVYTLMDHMDGGSGTAALLWQRSGLGARDVDVAELYDGFSPSAYYWLEAAGMCPEGEASRFVQDGRIALNGELPVNTFGGSLSEGRLHGMGHLIEAARQVAGNAGPRQVPGAGVALVLDGSPMLRNAGLLLGRSPS